ncbi:MAG: sensor histidine kinase [Actinomycetales bacterium]
MSVTTSFTAPIPAADEPGSSAPRRSIRLLAPLADPRTWLRTLHLLLSLPVGTVSFAFFVTAVSLSFGLVPLALVGVALLAVTVLGGRVFGSVERARARALLGVEVTPPPSVRGGERGRALLRTLLTDAAGWRGLLYGLLLLPSGVIGFTLAVTIWSLALAGIAAPLVIWLTPAPDVNFIDIPGVPLWARVVVAFVLGVAALLAAPHVVRGWAAVEAALVRSLLGATSMTERVRELESSRDRAVQAAAAERRRIERDLHDGAQVRLTALAMQLGRAKEALPDDSEDPVVRSSAALVRDAHEQAKAALVEVRALARGIAPAILSERGLDPALSSLAAASPVPVDLEVSLPSRLPERVESAAYYVVAEALANVAKHSGASRARVEVSCGPSSSRDQVLRVLVGDDGRGGAAARPDSGLTGLAARLAALDGRLTVTSPTGGPTTVVAEVPCGS